MEEEMKLQLAQNLERLGWRHVSIDSIKGNMVLGTAVWDGKHLEFVFNILSSDMVFRSKGFYTDGFGEWEEV